MSGTPGTYRGWTENLNAWNKWIYSSLYCLKNNCSVRCVYAVTDPLCMPYFIQCFPLLLNVYFDVPLISELCWWWHATRNTHNNHLMRATSVLLLCLDPRFLQAVLSLNEIWLRLNIQLRLNGDDRLKNSTRLNKVYDMQWKKRLNQIVR